LNLFSIRTQVIIQHHSLFSTEEILGEIMQNLFEKVDFFPCYYKSYTFHDEFFVFKNFAALKILMMRNLEYEMPNNPKKLTFSLRLNAASFKEGQIDWFHKIKYVMAKRLKENILDLSDFKNDPEFHKMKVTLNSNFTVDLILEQAKRDHSHITQINLQNNQISSLIGLAPIIMFEKLTTLDLRNNAILSLEGMCRTSSIKELLLDGNPICKCLLTSSNYVGELKKYFFSLEWIDGYRIDKAYDLVSLQNFLVKKDAYTFTEEFVKTFFTIYDSFERKRLAHFFHDQSTFTVSIYCELDRSAFNLKANMGSRVQNYTNNFARNILVLSDLNKACDNVFTGRSKIMYTFDRLPRTAHNFASFCIDVPVFESDIIVITVNGIFEEHGQLLNESSVLFGFTRTFILHPKANDEYWISNDQLLIRSLTIAQKNELHLSTLQAATESQINMVCADVSITELEKKHLKLRLFQELTEMNNENCRRLLEESFWDLKVALATFNTLMDSNAIPDNQFNFK
jgi:nuclear RNA export factor